MVTDLIRLDNNNKLHNYMLQHVTLIGMLHKVTQTGLLLQNSKSV